jgi:PAS domain S-box-containing protein
MSDEAFTNQIQSDPILRLVLDSIKDQGAYTLDSSGVVTTWNVGSERLKGYSSDEVIGKHIRLFYTIEDQERRHPESNLEAAREKGAFHEERVRVRKSGEKFQAEVSIYPIEENGHFTGFAKIVRDVSERKRLEIERDLVEQQLRASKIDLEGFCHSIAHDLRMPIRGIASKCGILLEDYSSALPDEVRDYLVSISESSLRLGHIVEDLLKFAKLSKGGISSEEIDVSELASRLAREIEADCQHGSGRIDVQQGIRARSNPSMLEFVIRNLLENSCKYSHANVNVHFGAEEVEGATVFHVRDDGLGFDMQFADKLFEPFERLHSESAIEGTGIGLANVKRIVERQGGRVWAESSPDEGATFFFTLGTGVPIS